MGREDQPTDEIETAGGGRRRRLADPPLIASGRRLGGRYLLERPLGHGGMAAVWLATDERLERAVAIKVISDSARRRRRSTAAASAARRAWPPGSSTRTWSRVYDFDAGERPYLVMEYIPGGDLADADRDRRRPQGEQLARELLSALRHIHVAGVLHRDIKPQNVLIDDAGTPG